MNMKLFLLAGLLLVLAGCSSMSASEKEDKRGKLDAMAEKAIADLVEKDPALQGSLDNLWPMQWPT